ncbi:MAG: division/cell wall cluster transcriptional repressor MraZ [Candidatus Omnitrophota bacterium]
MFYGEFSHSLDRKNRLIVPAKFRELLQESYAEKLIITRGLDRCLFVFSEEEWKTQEVKFKALPFTKSESRKFNRLYFSGACEMQIDKQGRILVPAYLKTYAEIKKDVVLVGVSNRIEIWAKDKWEEFYLNTKDSFEEIAERLMDEKESS